MEKSKLMKLFLVIVVSMALVLVSTQNFAADNTTNFIDITDNTIANNTNTNTNTDANTNSNTNTNTNTNALNTNSNTNTNSVTSSSYNNTNLPSTGIAQNGSIACIVFVLMISAIYAFKKIRDYNNI